jgi:Family of unknown function (DUF6339)
MRVLSTQSVEQLRNIVRKDEKFVVEPLEELVGRYSLTMVNSDLELPKNFKLEAPINLSWSGNRDRENAELIQTLIPNLTRANATDERFWVTLAFREALEYSVLRWGGDEGNNKLILNHWFAPTSRSRWRDHSVARLWYVSSFAAGLESIPLKDALDVLYSNSELLNSFLGRPRTTASNRVSSKIISLLHKNGLGDGGTNFDRGKFRMLMKEIDLRSGSININALGDSDFDAFFEDLFVSIYA